MCNFQATIVEGMYWKRRLETVCAQYTRWRQFNLKHLDRRRKSITRDVGLIYVIFNWSIIDFTYLLGEQFIQQPEFPVSEFVWRRSVVAIGREIHTTDELWKWWRFHQLVHRYAFFQSQSAVHVSESETIWCIKIYQFFCDSFVKNGILMFQLSRIMQIWCNLDWFNCNRVWRKLWHH